MALKRPFKSLLIANRGEIAVRVARTCRAMGIRSIGIYSDADKHALHVKTCDETVAIGGVAARDSYLRGDKILAAARRAGAQALHPGYGFLSENAAFAQACADAGIAFIGPSPRAMRAMGDKIAAKESVAAVGVPVVPGFSERIQSHERLKEEAQRLGTPLLIKAAAGGGGRGMRLVTDLQDLDEALEGARREALAAFGDGTVFLERYVTSPRHIEVQILADQHGQSYALGERECSIQRRYQKIVEESPSPAVDSALRAQLQAAAIKAARSVDYTNAGTVEFMLERDGRFYFLEMNARLQVEHPVTEAVTGLDLVREQINIAAGERLQLDEAFTVPRGHAIEVRLYAEDPEHDFLPASGTITAFAPPEGPGIRNDVAVTQGSEVSSNYDPMLGKLIVYDRDRAECIQRLRSALDDYVVGGIATNLPLLRSIVNSPAFASGETTTDFLEHHLAPHKPSTKAQEAVALIAAAGALQYVRSTTHDMSGGASDIWQSLGAWRHAGASREVFFVESEGPVHAVWDYEHPAWRCSLGRSEALIQEVQPGLFLFRTPKEAVKFAAWSTPNGLAISWQDGIRRFRIQPSPAATYQGGHKPGESGSAGLVSAPMSGTIVKVLVKPNDAVNALQVIIVMEAMKMEHSIVAPYAGTVRVLKVGEGDTVAAGDVLAEISEA
ncbi:MAG: acetyl-CoA carboxylase biotin carboxylase subunit [Candidatus Eremiobacteraeota bacterium]|nr:acetyl-CoA carboxylase biotin carboxylase subunit [Candidatus Eremiobacteraeota bacterium]